MDWKALAIQLFIYTLTCVYSCLSILKLFVLTFKLGWKVFEVKERTLPPPCLSSDEYGKHSYAKLKDVKLHYVEMGDPQKPLMLFVHGFPEFWYSWRHQIKYFAATHWVVAIDQRGYGDSEKLPNVSDYKLEALTNDIHQLVTQHFKREKVILVGHDWGAIVCWDVATKYAQMVDRLVILNVPHPSAMAIKLKKSLRQFLKSWYMFFFQMPYLPEFMMRLNDMSNFSEMFVDQYKKPFLTHEELECYKYIFGKPGGWTPPINYYRNIMTPSRFVEKPTVQKVKVKTLILWGVHDLALERDLAEMSMQFVQDVRVQYIEDGTHFVQQDKPQAVNEKIKIFLSQR